MLRAQGRAPWVVIVYTNHDSSVCPVSGPDPGMTRIASVWDVGYPTAHIRVWLPMKWCGARRSMPKRTVLYRIRVTTLWLYYSV